MTLILGSWVTKNLKEKISLDILVALNMMFLGAWFSMILVTYSFAQKQFCLRIKQLTWGLQRCGHIIESVFVTSFSLDSMYG